MSSSSLFLFLLLTNLLLLNLLLLNLLSLRLWRGLRLNHLLLTLEPSLLLHLLSLNLRRGDGRPNDLLLLPLKAALLFHLLSLSLRHRNLWLRHLLRTRGPPLFLYLLALSLSNSLLLRRGRLLLDH